MIHNIPPCKDCKDRQIGCHDKCDRYINWQSEYLEEKKHIKENKRKFNQIESFFIERRIWGSSNRNLPNK